MAEAVNETNQPVGTSKEKDGMECAVCLQPCIHPAKLPCGHIFCFLCVKGFANQSKKCAMCRQEIPRDFIDQPNLVQPIPPVDNAEGFDGGYQWYYEGRNGWWQYDERTSIELETAYKKNSKNCELLIAGFLYVIDFEQSIQMRRNDHLRRRKIKRDFGIPKKGIAGLRIGTTTPTESVILERPASPTEGALNQSSTPQLIDVQSSGHSDDYSEIDTTSITEHFRMLGLLDQ